MIGAHGQSQQGEMTLGKAAVFDDINNIDTTWCTGTTHSYSEYQFLSSSNILNRYKDLEPWQLPDLYEQSIQLSRFNE